MTVPRTKMDTLMTEAAATLLYKPLTPPLQFELYMTRAFNV